MPAWMLWLLLGLAAWILVSVLIIRFVAISRARPLSSPIETAERWASPPGFAQRRPRELAELRTGATPAGNPGGEQRRRILVVDDDPALRLLLSTTLAADEFAVEEAGSAEEAADIVRFWAPAVVILDIGLPGMDGLAFCHKLKQNAGYGAPLVVLLTGAETSDREIEFAGPDAVLRKPFSPLELVALLDRLSDATRGLVFEPPERDEEQLLIYAQDLSRLLEIERSQRRLLEHAYRQTATALADALEAKDPITGLHALRVQRYALELTAGLDPSLLDDPSLEYGFLLHDVGKIGISDTILQKAGPLSDPERRLMQRHTLLGAQLLSDVVLLQGEGLKVVRSHHERWDGNGYPDGLAGRQIPVGARIFALVDSLDAMTSERPYRRALSWEEAVNEILAENGHQFDPWVAGAFAAREGPMRRISEEMAEHAA